MNRSKMGIGTYQFIVGIFGFILVMLTFVIMGEIFDTFELWVTAGASGFDVNIWTFMQNYWFFLPVIFVFTLGLWAFNELQKRPGDFV